METTFHVDVTGSFASGNWTRISHGTCGGSVPPSTGAPKFRESSFANRVTPPSGSLFNCLVGFFDILASHDPFTAHSILFRMSHATLSSVGKALLLHTTA